MNSKTNAYNPTPDTENPPSFSSPQGLQLSAVFFQNQHAMQPLLHALAANRPQNYSNKMVYKNCNFAKNNLQHKIRNI